MRIRTGAVTLIVFACTAGLAEAAPFTIQLIAAQYQTFVSVDEHTPTGSVLTERTRTDVASLQDALLWQDSMLDRTFGAAASASLFAVSTMTGSGYIDGFDVFSSHQKAHALSQLTFVPTGDGIGAFTMDFAAGGSNPSWSSGYVRVTDLTLGSVMVERGWDKPEGFYSTGTVPWMLGDDATYPYSASLPFSLAFSVSHLYQLELYARSDANWDRQLIEVRVNGIHTVPEPASLMLMGVGGALAYGAHRRGRKPRNRGQSQ